MFLMSTESKPRSSACILSAALLALLSTSTLAATPEDPYTALLIKMDWPEGKPFFGWGSHVKKAEEVWSASAGRTYIELALQPSRDRSRIVHRLTSEPRPVPPAAIAELGSTVPETGWFEYWVKTRVEPTNGAADKRMFSMAERRLVRCEPAFMINAARLYFASLDASGEPYDIAAQYNKPERYLARTIGKSEPLRSEYRAICGPVLAAMYGAERVEARIDGNLAPPELPGPLSSMTPEDREKLLAEMRALLKLAPSKSASDAASDLEGVASSAAADRAGGAASDSVGGVVAAPGMLASDATSSALVEPVPLGAAKARIRLFAQNGTAVNVTNEAACSAEGSAAESGSNLLKNLASALHVASNESLGMPESTTTRRLSDRSGAFSKAYFVERAITAEMPVTVDFTFAANNQTCPSMAVSFVPEADADYESKLDVGYGYCFVSVGRILSSGTVAPVPVTHAPACPSKK